MKKIMAKLRKVRAYKWNMLSSGEKVLKVIMKLVKWALIVAAVVGIIALVASVWVAAVIGLSIASAVGGGFRNASKAYRPGDVHVKF